jgi:hypothetical protein
MRNTAGLLFFFLITCGAAHGQRCGCEEKQWRAEIALREATLKKVIATGNREAILAVANLIVGAGLRPIADTLGNPDPECTKMSNALAEESKVETKMITDYTEALKNHGEHN